MRGHTPVLLEEVMAGLDVKSGGFYIDCTFGRGGHTRAILERIGPVGRVLAIDRDPAAVAAAREHFGGDMRLTVTRGSFGQIAEYAHAAGFSGGAAAGVLFDLGLSSPQLDEAARGFSFSADGPLDMRMDPDKGETAADWLARAPEREIARVLKEYGEERFAARIARAVATARKERKITRTAELAQLVERAVPSREPGKHPATRSFQAIRIQINAELDELEAALASSVELLAAGGRLCAISFHSLEDGIVKRFIEREARDDPMWAGLPDIPAHARARLRRVGRLVHPSPAEVARNPRARSARLRIAERLAA
jgi:16S rRNA (cytosine1402-N4)-methyltransferase